MLLIKLEKSGMSMNNKVYIVIAYRWGNKESHNYIVGIYDNVELAMSSAKNEREWRINKYICEILEYDINIPKKYKVIKAMPGYIE